MFFLWQLSRNFDDRLSSNFHRFIILCICWDILSEKTDLWQLLIMFSVFHWIEIVNTCFCVVSDCSPNKWGLSCDNDCSFCYNGGQCDDTTGDCICAPGFSGVLCRSGKLWTLPEHGFKVNQFERKTMWRVCLDGCSIVTKKLYVGLHSIKYKKGIKKK